MLARLPARWRHKIRRDRSGCWIWRGCVSARGYGQVRHERRTQSVHRVIYRELVGEIPEGFEIDHTCTSKLCVHPDHLEAITPAEHHRRTRERANERCKRREERRLSARLSDVCTSVYTDPPGAPTGTPTEAGTEGVCSEVKIGEQMELFAASGAGDGNRTRNSTLGRLRVATTPHRHLC